MNNLESGIICAKCGKVVKITINYKEKLYCNNCYQQEIMKDLKNLKNNVGKLIMKKAILTILFLFLISSSVFSEVYRQNNQNGLVKVYYESGKLWVEWNYKDGKLDGISKEYYESGILFFEGNYTNNEKDGISKTYDGSGKIDSIDTYKEGIRINSKKYDALGKEIMNYDCPY